VGSGQEEKHFPFAILDFSFLTHLLLVDLTAKAPRSRERQEDIQMFGVVSCDLVDRIF